MPGCVLVEAMGPRDRPVREDMSRVVLRGIVLGVPFRESHGNLTVTVLLPGAIDCVGRSIEIPRRMESALFRCVREERYHEEVRVRRLRVLESVPLPKSLIN